MGHSASFWCLYQKFSASLFHCNKTLLHKSSEWSSLVSGPEAKILFFRDHKSDTVQGKLSVSRLLSSYTQWLLQWPQPPSSITASRLCTPYTLWVWGTGLIYILHNPRCCPTPKFQILVKLHFSTSWLYNTLSYNLLSFITTEVNYLLYWLRIFFENHHKKRIWALF